MATLRRQWTAADPDTSARARTVRDDLLLEVEVEPGVFHQAHGPFVAYERRVEAAGAFEIETIDYRTDIPWFGFLFAPLIRRSLRDRPGASTAPGTQPWWAPRDRLDERQVLVLGLMAAASLVAAFVNTLFTQTVSFASDEFGISNAAQGRAGTIVRFGILLVAPLAARADRIGRRKVILIAATAAPLLASLGAVAPSFGLLTASQTIARPVGLVLDLLIGVMIAEEMPKNSRAYAVSLTALAAGLGSGVCVMSLRLADIGPWAWRLVYVVPLIWLLVAADLIRRLPETRRFEVHHRHVGQAAAAANRLVHRKRLLLLGSVAFMGNMFVAPASFFQNRYLDDVRGYSAGGIALFTIATTTPVGLGVLFGGRIADRTGRRRIGALALALGTSAIVCSFGLAGGFMWLAALTGGIVLGATVPALGVYRTELFATGNRSLSSYLLTASALVGGSIGLLTVGWALDNGWSHVRILGLFAIGQLAAATIVLTLFPETAHRELEEINPEDAVDVPELRDALSPETPPTG